MTEQRITSSTVLQANILTAQILQSDAAKNFIDPSSADTASESLIALHQKLIDHFSSLPDASKDTANFFKNAGR